MKVLRSLIVLALCVALSLQEEDEEELVHEAHQTTETKET